MKTVLFLHGALGTKKQFESIFPFLNPHFKIYSFNFDGHGGNNSTQDFSIQLFTENTFRFLDENNLDSVYIFGYSMGGYVALNLALLHPEKVESIVTLGTKFKWDLDSATKEVKMLNPEKIEEKVLHFANKLKNDHAPSDWKILMRKTADMMMGMGKGKKLHDEYLNKISHKVTIGIGDKDHMVSIEESESAAQILPNGKIKILPNFPHPIEKVNPEELAFYIQNNIG